MSQEKARALGRSCSIVPHEYSTRLLCLQSASQARQQCSEQGIFSERAINDDRGRPAEQIEQQVRLQRAVESGEGTSFSFVETLCVDQLAALPYERTPGARERR